MKTKFIFKITGLCLIFLTVMSFRFLLNKREIQTISIEDAIDKRLIQVDFLSNGTYQGNSIVSKIKNLSNLVLKLKVKSGTYFNAFTDEEQDLITVKDLFVQLSPRSNLNKNIDGYCCIASNRCPIKENKFRIVPNKIQHFDKFKALFVGKNYSHSIVQDAVWALSDKHPISNITSENPLETKSLREELSKITGLKNEWYETPQIRNVDPFGNINRETVAVQGNIEFDNKVNATFHQEVQDKNGVILMKTEKPFKIGVGKVKYFFKLQVTGWEKGKYYVKLYNGNVVLHVNEFEV